MGLYTDDEISLAWSAIITVIAAWWQSDLLLCRVEYIVCYNMLFFEEGQMF